MERLPSWLYRIAPLIVAGALAGCAAHQGPGPGARGMGAMHGEEYGGSSGGMMGQGMAEHMNPEEKQEMCDRYRRMHGAKTYEEQRAMMSERMRGMSQEEVDRQMEMMRSQCQ